MKPYNYILTVEHVRKLRAACDTFSPKGKRDLAILDTMLFQGLRLIEVADLRLQDFHNVGDQFILQLKSRSDGIKIHDTYHHTLKAWIDQRGMSFEKVTGPVFVPISKFDRHVSKSLSRQTISHLVARYGNLAGLTPLKGPDRLKPGDLRRTCARNAYDHGADLVSLQAFLGFNYLETVARYIGILNGIKAGSVKDHINYEEK
jgi:site-specific recombinase XerD